MLTDVGKCPTSVTCGDSSYDSLRAAAKRRLLACTRLRAQSQEEPFCGRVKTLPYGRVGRGRFDTLRGLPRQFENWLAMTWK